MSKLRGVGGVSDGVEGGSGVFLMAETGEEKGLLRFITYSLDCQKFSPFPMFSFRVQLKN